jgi:hypothetical protein
MKSTRFLISTLGIALLAGGGSAVAQRYSYGPQASYAPQASYDPPVERGQRRRDAEFQRRGFQDGTVGADRDFQNHRRPNVNNRDEFRNPNFIPRWAREAYREGFRRGYEQRARQIYRGRR